MENIEETKQKLDSILGQLLDVKRGLGQTMIIENGEWNNLLIEAVSREIEELKHLLNQGNCPKCGDEVLNENGLCGRCI